MAKDVASKDNALSAQLVELISHVEKSVRIASCQAIMTICITTAGKLAAFEHNICEKLLTLIDEALAVSIDMDDCVDAENDSLRLNAIRAVQVISEVPSARLIFNQKENVRKIDDGPENRNHLKIYCNTYDDFWRICNFCLLPINADQEPKF